MPTVPTSNVSPMLPPQKGGAEAPSPTMLAMAAAMMHSEGKLGATEPKKPNDRSHK